MDDLLSSLTPEQIEQLLGLSMLDDESGLLEQQMAQAMALRQPSGNQYSTGAGAAMGGIADILRDVRGGLDQNELHKKQRAILEKQLAGRKTYAGALFPRQQTEDIPDIIPSTPFGF